MMKDFVKIFQKSLCYFIKELLKEEKINGEKFNVIELYVKENEYKDILDQKQREKEPVPFVLVRPINSIQDYPNHKRTQNYLIRVVIKDKENEGLYTVIRLANKIIDYFTAYPAEIGNYQYSVDIAEKIKSQLNEEQTAGDYWTYDITVPTLIPYIGAGTTIKRLEQGG